MIVVEHAVSVDLIADEAQSFLLFRKHQELFQALLQAGVEHIRSGKAVLSFNHDGVLMEVEVQEKRFARKKPWVYTSSVGASIKDS